MNQKLLFIIDPLETLSPFKDTSLALMKAAQGQGHSCYICNMYDFIVSKDTIFIDVHPIGLADDYRNHHIDKIKLSKKETLTAESFHTIFMRKDPPVDDAYIYCTHILSLIEKMGVRVLNSPNALRDFNEKIFSFYFPDLIPAFCLCHHYHHLEQFALKHKEIICKPINGMGGQGVFKTSSDDPNLSVIFEMLTQNGKQPILAQEFLPDIKKGDKRILILNGEIFPFALARIPTGYSIRGNLAAGGTYEHRALTKRDQEIAQKIADILPHYQIDICGIDIIGDYLTEINITSPTCFLQLSDLTGRDIAQEYIQKIV